MLKNKFYKNLLWSLNLFLSIILISISLLLIYFEGLKYEDNLNWIFLLIALSLICLYFIIGFYWIFQKVIIDEDGITITLINKIIKKYKWEEILSVEKSNFYINPLLRIKLVNGSKLRLDKRKSIINAIKKYSQKNLFKHNYGSDILEWAYEKNFKGEHMSYEEFVIMLSTNDELYFYYNKREYRVEHHGEINVYMCVYRYEDDKKILERSEEFNSIIELLTDFRIEGKSIYEIWPDVLFQKSC